MTLTKLQKLDYKNEQIELILRKIHNETINYLEINKDKPTIKLEYEPIDNKKVITIGLIMGLLYIIARLSTH